jgi:hypothetical protein
MTGNPLYSLLFSFFLVLCVISAGCSDESPPAEGATPTPAHPDAKYSEGDIIATASSSASSSLYLILKYDAATDQYTRAVIEKNADGSWGHRSSDWTEKIPRATLEKTYTVKAGHVAVSIVPVITPAVLSETPQSNSGNAPSIVKISPSFAVRDTVVSVTITGSDFQNGATVRLFKAGSAPINATVTSVTAFDISCFFNLNGKNDGSYNLIVINPDGQSDSQQAIFTIGEASPVIAGIYPVTGAVNDKVPLTISGQNFRNEVKVSFMKNSTEMVCDKPLSMESSKISCTLDLATNRGASAGEWNVTVLNIRDGRKSTWIKKFVVTNATLQND